MWVGVGVEVEVEVGVGVGVEVEAAQRPPLPFKRLSIFSGWAAPRVTLVASGPWPEQCYQLVARSRARRRPGAGDHQGSSGDFFDSL